jgi:hypothetical protein
MFNCTQKLILNIYLFLKKLNMSSEDLSAKILRFLESKEDYVSTIGIAKEVVGENARAKDVNPTLYSLLSKKKVQKTANDNGGAPHWKICPK